MIFYSSFQDNYLWLPLLGLAIGLLASMVGGGGGIVFFPLLILLFNVPAQVAVSTSLAATLPVCFVGALSHYRKGNLNLRIGLLFGTAGILGALLGAGLTRLMTQEQLKMAFGMYCVLLAFIVAFWNRSNGKGANKQEEQSQGLNTRNISMGSIYGFFAGIISGTFGSSGAAPVMAGLFAHRLPVRAIAGTSLMVVLINTLSALGGHLLVGQIDLVLLIMLTSGTVIGSFLGPVLLSHIKVEGKEIPIRLTFALIIFVLGIFMLIR